MIIKNVSLETVCGITSEIPDNQLDEIAFAGKSNVGKSSLINVLMNRKGFAHISAQPGKTQTINFYNINDAMYLVDLPGYGYTRANVEIKAQWGKMIERYLHASKRLRAVFLLVDIRHEPSENDRIMYSWMLDQGYAPIIIATKQDKIRKSQINKQKKMISDTLGAKPGTVIIPFSALTKEGCDEIWETVGSLIDLPEWMRPKKEEIDAASGQKNPGRERKPRWKDEGRPAAKKTVRRQKKAAEKNARINEQKSRKQRKQGKN
ncbi:MAG: ribosome biogenesis GTP-binding protein YihA/YsxC [Clostridiales bacterium]|nr:ribosome biogenesis GTP-binding protein YihA/YsxC [Clostridiales bacterium]